MEEHQKSSAAQHFEEVRQQYKKAIAERMKALENLANPVLVSPSVIRRLRDGEEVEIGGVSVRMSPRALKAASPFMYGRDVAVDLGESL